MSAIEVRGQLEGQRVLVIGGSAGIGLETARSARAAGAEVIITARDPQRLSQAGREVGAATEAFDATDFDRLERFFAELDEPIDHVLVTGPGPYYAPLAEFDFDAARRDVESHLFLPIQIARSATSRVRAGGTLLAIHLMANTALTGATFDIDGGQQLVES
jgi:NAD(P)-dependent dehydrogenase (short-subunit alcohol dehydrogenase family)